MKRMDLGLRGVLLAAIVTICVAASVSAQTNTGAVSVDGISGVLVDGVLWAGYSHTLWIRYDFSAFSTGTWNSNNAFELYSPDGANWVNLLGADGPLTTALPGSIAKYRKYYTSVDGGLTYTATASGGSMQPGGSAGPNSRVAYSLAVYSPTGAGYASGSSGIALTLQFQCLMADTGKTICLDTVNAAGAVAWQWTSGTNTDLPVWDNGLGESAPRCWEIGTCCNCTPYWVDWNPGNISFGYCQSVTHNIFAAPFCKYGSIEYRMLPPFNNGEYGSIDAHTGQWTWPEPHLAPGTGVPIQFQASQMGIDVSEPFTLNVHASVGNCACCVGRVGDANGSGEDEPTVGDISALIDHLFISSSQIICIEEADVNQSGGATPYDEDVTIGDVSALIDYLFITGAEHGILPNCM